MTLLEWILRYRSQFIGTVATVVSALFSLSNKAPQVSFSPSASEARAEPVCDQTLYTALLLTLMWQQVVFVLRPIWRRSIHTVGDPLVAALLCLGFITVPAWIIQHQSDNTPTTSLILADADSNHRLHSALTDGSYAPQHRKPSTRRQKNAYPELASVHLSNRHYSEMQRGGYAPRISSRLVAVNGAPLTNVRDTEKNSDAERLLEFAPAGVPWGVLSREPLYALTHANFPRREAPGDLIPLANSAGRLSVFTPVIDDNFYTVMLDPGHGGSDPGTIGANGLLEKHITLDLAFRVQQLLAAHPNIQVELTRHSDQGYTRNARLRQVRKIKPDVLVSLHLNNLPQRNLNLVESFYAARDNIMASEQGSTQNVNPRFTRTRAPATKDYSFVQGSRALSEILQDKIYSSVSQVNPAALNAGIKQDTLYMLTQTYVPATLIELTCLSNSEEEIRLRTPEYRQQIATAIASGILEYLSRSGPSVET